MGGPDASFRSRGPPTHFQDLTSPARIRSRLGDLLLFDELLKLASLEHLHHDVRAADELALDVELRNGRPFRIVLDALPDLRILEDIDGLERDAEMVEDGDGAAREAALREQGGSLHEQDDVVLADDF